MNIRQLARMCDVSRQTVSLALRGSKGVAPATMRRIQALARKLDYHPDPRLAVQLAKVASSSRRDRATIAMLSPWPSRQIWRHNWVLEGFHDGILLAAARLGYQVEEFWLGEPGMSGRRMRDILLARGIEGVVILNYTEAPADLGLDLLGFAAAVVGRALIRPAIHTVDHDHGQGMRLALDEIARAGHRRIGCCLLDETALRARTSGDWEAQYLLHQHTLPSTARVPLLTVKPGDKATLRAWLERWQPDALAGSNHEVGLLLEAAAGHEACPAFFNLMWDSRHTDDSGVDPCFSAIGEVALEMVSDDLRAERHLKGTIRRHVLLEGRWRLPPYNEPPGSRLRSRATA